MSPTDRRLAAQLRLLAGEGRFPSIRGPAFGRPPLWTLRTLRAIRLATFCAGVLTVGGGASATAVLLARHWRALPAVSQPAPPAPGGEMSAGASSHRRHPRAAPAPALVPVAPPAVPVFAKRPPAVRRMAAAPRPPAAAVGIGQEADLLRQALLAWRAGADDAGALTILDTYARQFPQGALTWEAAALRARVLLHVGQRDAALGLLDRLPLSQAGVSADLIVVRGELRSLAGRCLDAVADFDWVLHASARLAGTDRARALYGRASCRSRLGDVVGAQQDRDGYLREFPGGPAAEKLGSPP